MSVEAKDHRIASTSRGEKNTPARLSRGALFDDERAGRIYRIAAQMIYEQGFAATSMNEIAEAVELTKPGLYYYVKGKKELLFAIMSFAMDLLDVEVVVPAQKARDAETRLRIIISRHARLLTHEAGALAILIDEDGSLSETQRIAISARKRAYFDFVRDTLETLRAEGRLHDVDTTTATFSLLGMVMWLARWYQSDGRMSAGRVVEEVTQIALCGIIRQGARDQVVDFKHSAASASKWGKVAQQYRKQPNLPASSEGLNAIVREFRDDFSF